MSRVYTTILGTSVQVSFLWPPCAFNVSVFFSFLHVHTFLTKNENRERNETDTVGKFEILANKSGTQMAYNELSCFNRTKGVFSSTRLSGRQGP